MDYRTFKLYYFVLYKRQNNTYFLQKIMQPTNTHLYSILFVTADFRVTKAIESLQLGFHYQHQDPKEIIFTSTVPI